MQIHPDEIEDDKEVMMIWDFNVGKVNLSLTASQCLVKANITCCVNSIVSMPYLDLNSINCNCAKSSTDGRILLSSCSTPATTMATSATTAASHLQRLSLSDMNDENVTEDDDEKDEEEEDLDFGDEFSDTDLLDQSEIGKLFAPEATVVGEALYTEAFTLKASSCHEHFQNALKLCTQKMINKEPVPIQLSFEPVNKTDENGILVHACYDGAWKPVGYIPGVEVAKVTQAIKNKEITDMAINSIKYQYIFPIASFKYFASVTITKKGTWKENRDSYKYNEDI